MSVGEKVAVDGVKTNLDVVASSTMYIAPPLVAAQSVNVTDCNVSVFDAGTLAYTAPPFPDSHTQEVNWTFESV